MTTVVDLLRIATSDKGTLGVLLIDGAPTCVTCENPWKDNKPQVSCIPEGTYKCRSYSGTKYKNVWIIDNVPGRSAILIHWGNTEKDTWGCVLVGKYFAQFGDLPGVAASVETIGLLRKKLPKEFTLNVRFVK